MSARNRFVRAIAHLGALLALVTGIAKAQIDLGLNPSLSSGSQTLNTGDLFSGTYSVSGSGVIYLGSSYTQPSATTLAFSGTGGTYLSYTGGGPFTFTLPTTSTLTRSAGAGGYTYVYDNIVNNGTITVSSGTLQFQSGTTLTNAVGATTTVTGSGSALYLIGLANSGSLIADSLGVIQLAGSFTTAGLGSISLTNGGLVKLISSGTLNNTSATLTAPAGGAYTLFGGTITGGTINSAALAFSSSGGTLDGATINGNLNLNGGEVLTLKNGAGATGTTTNNNATLYLGTSLTALANSAYIFTGTNSYLSYTGGGPFTLNLPSTASLTRSGTGYTYVYDNIANNGTVTVSGGNLQFQSGTTLTNTAGATSTVTGSGSTLYLAGLANAGSLVADSLGLIQLAGSFTTAGLGSISLTNGGTVRLNGTLNNTSATLTSPSGGAFDLYGGTITGGTIANGALNFTSSNGYLDGATYTGDLTLPASTYLRFLNGTTFTGSNLTLGSSSGIYWQQISSLAAKAINFGSNSYIYLTGANSALTLDAATTATGQIQIYHDGSAGTAITNQGTLTNTSGSAQLVAHTVTNSGTYNQTGGSGNIYADTFTNSGTISATNGTLYLGYPSAGYNTTNTGAITSDGSGTNVYLRGNFTNSGSLTAQNSAFLTFDGANTTANLGTITLATGGRVRLNGTLNNTSATLTAPSGGAFDLYGGTITGGTIASGALTFTSSNGYLDGLTYIGDLSLPTSTYVRLLNGTTFTGSNLTLAANSGVYWQQVATLASRALSFAANSYIYLTGANSSLTLDAATTATGQIQIYHDGSTGTAITNQGTLTNTSGSAQLVAHTVTNSGSYFQTGGSGSIYADTFTNSGTISATAGTLYLGYPSAGYNTTNTGAITSDGSGTNIYLRGNFTNSGSLTAQNSAFLTFDGANTTANLGTITLATGGRVRLNGTLNNTSATLTAPSGGTFDLLGGTITSGTIASGALTFTGSGGYLDGVTYTGDLSLPTSTYVRLLNGTTFTGANLTLAANSGVYWQQVATLASRALSFAANSYIYLTGVNSAITLDSATTATGQIQIYHDGSTGTAITNQGTLTNTSGSAQLVAHTVTNSGSYFQTGGSGSIYADTFTNSGTISATAGTLYLGYPSAGYNTTNTGSITSDGSGTNIYLRGNFTNSGSLTAQNSGFLTFDGTNTTANLGTITLATGGRVRLNGTLTNTSATLTAPSGGTFDLLGGTITGGTIASGALTFTSSGGYLDGVTYTGNVTLPTSAQAYITGGTTFGGTAITLGNSAYLYWQQTGTLSGQAITLAPGAAIYLSGVSRSLTLAADTTITGNTNVYSDGSIGSSITNLGSITNSNSSTGYLYARSFTNSGNIAATSGTLYLGASSTGYAFTNTAGSTITANGGNIVIQAPTGNPIVNQGAINVQSGTLYTSNLLTNGATGTITGAGTINGNLVVPSGTLAPGNSGVGTLSLLGSLTLGSGANTVFELNGTNSDRITGISTLTLGGQFTLYALSTTFSSGQTWNLFSATTITGNFSSFNLPYTNDGWVWDTSQLGTTGNLVLTTFVPVPEPSTYLLLAAGLGVIFALRRRRIR